MGFSPGALWAAAGALAISLVMASAVAPTADARFATGGVGRFVSAVDWIEWGTNGQVITPGPITRSSTSSVGGLDLEVTCTLSNVTVTSNGNVQAYKPGGFGGDAMDDMYNIGGTSGANQLVNSFRNASGGHTVNADFSCSATLGPDPLPLEGIVIGDAEASAGSGEWVQGSIASGSDWHVIDRHRSASCTFSPTTVGTNNGVTNTLRFSGTSLCNPQPGPAAVMFGEATQGSVALRGGGVSALAFGAVVTIDHGDAPATYGDAAHVLQYPFNGGTPASSAPPGTTTASIFPPFALGATTQPTPRIGPSVDPGGVPSAGALGDDNLTSGGAFGADNDETELPAGPVDVVRNSPFTLPAVACNGPGTLTGWIDFDDNGTFDADERAADTSCTAASSLTWASVPPDAIDQGQAFLRLRAASNAAEIASPTGVAFDGETEDHALALAVGASDLGIEKTPSAPSVDPGDPLSFTLEVSNAGPEPSPTATITDTLSAGLAYDDAGSDPRCDQTGTLPTVVTCTLGAIPAGGPPESLTIATTVDAGAGSTVQTNTATVVGPNPDHNPGNDADAVSVPIPPIADLSVTKSAAPDPVDDGANVTYTLDVANAGPTDSDVELTDTLPAVLTYDDALSDARCDQTGTGPTVITCDLGRLDGGDPATTVTIVATVAESASGSFANAATVASTDNPDTPGVDPVPERSPADNQDSVTSQIAPPESDLRLEKTAPAGPFTIGSQIPYTLTVTNQGPDASPAVTLTDELPAGMEYVSNDSGCDVTALPEITCELGPMADDATRAVEIVVRAQPSASNSVVQNTAEVSGPNVDPEPLDNESSASVTVLPASDLAIDKTPSAATVDPGDPLSFTLEVSNGGPDPSPGATITDTLSDGLAYDDAGTDARCNQTGTTPTVVTCTLGAMAVGGAPESLTIATTVDTGAGSTVQTNSATVDGDNFDPESDNDTDSADVSIPPVADLSVTKSATPNPVDDGDNVTYTLDVANAGPTDSDVELTDTLPAVLTYDDALSDPRCDQTGTGPTVITCDLGRLDGGDPATTVTIVATVAEGATGSFANAATVASTDNPDTPGVDPVPERSPADNQDSVTSQIAPPESDLHLVKTAPSGPLGVGAQIPYAFTVTNDGPDPSPNTVVTDRLPASLTYVTDDGGCNVSGRDITCALGTLAADATETFSVIARLDTITGSPITNSASVSGANSDPEPADNGGTATTAAAPDLAPVAKQRRCFFGHNVTILGTNASETITGTPGRDVINGRRGNDVILGLEGNDLLCGGAGEDLIKGGLGDDRVKGSLGDDDVRGNLGDDWLRGAPGDDVITGRRGDDRLMGNDGDDRLHGRQGNDQLIGGPGDDWANGGRGRDKERGV